MAPPSANSETRGIMKHPLHILALLVVAFWLRLPSFEWMHIDERAFIIYPLGFWSGDLDPHFFNYPTLQLYLTSILYALYWVVSSSESLMSFVSVRYFVDASDLLEIARDFNTFMAVGTVFCAMGIATRLYDQRAGLFAGWVLALMPLHVRFSHLAIVDIGATFWVACYLWALVAACQDKRRSGYILAGVFLGLAISTKYPAAAAGLALIPWQWSHIRRYTLPALCAALLVFAATSPYVFLSFPTAWEHISSMWSEHLGGAHGQPFGHHVTHNLWYGVLPTIGALVAVGALWPCRGEAGWRVMYAGLGISIFLLFTGSSFMRYLLPLTPIMAVLAARVTYIWDGSCIPRKPAWLGVVAACLCLFLPAYGSVTLYRHLDGPDTRIIAQEYLEAQTVRRIVARQAGPEAGQVRIFRPDQFFERQIWFVRSFGQERLADAVRHLAGREDLPPLFGHWIHHATDNPDHSTTEDVLLIIYDHPLSKPTKIPPQRPIYELDPGVIWNIAYDTPDWFFVPVSPRPLKATGPRILIYRTPMSPRAPLPSTRQFFEMIDGYLDGWTAINEERWEDGLRHYEKILKARFAIGDLFSGAYAASFFWGLAACYEVTGRHDRALWAEGIALEVERGREKR